MLASKDRQKSITSVLKGAVVTLASLFVIAVSGLPCTAFSMGAALTPRESDTKTVAFVYDGDTVRTANGLVIRYIGIDTPERGEPFYKKARNRNIELVNGKEVVLEVCKREPKDKYGRTLGWIYVGTVLVNRVLLEEGLARTLIIPPCGTEKRKEMIEAQRRAKDAKVGLWSK